jgi:hypothetical protein
MANTTDSERAIPVQCEFCKRIGFATQTELKEKGWSLTRNEVLCGECDGQAILRGFEMERAA